MSKVNWGALFNEYVESNKSIAEVLMKHNLSPNCGGNKEKTAGWGQKRAQLRHEIAAQARSKAKEEGADTLAFMDRQLFSLGTVAIEALHSYIDQKKILSPQEARIVLEMVLLRMNMPTKYTREEQVIPDRLPDDVVERLKQDAYNEKADK